MNIETRTHRLLIATVMLINALTSVYATDLQQYCDSAATQLNEIVVTSVKRQIPVIPVQTLTGEELQHLNSNSVADALRYFAGVQVKDYGGVGGIKTVNVRSMGTNHTGVVYDGVELGNAQNGQIDLGQFSLDNIESISLFNGQKSEILQPARDFGSAASIYMRTKVPEFTPGKCYNLRATVRTGSFDLFNPSLLFDLRLNRNISASLSAEWVSSSGKYKFRYKRVTPSGEVAYDTTAVRQNGDVDALRLEMNVNGKLRDGSWSFKAYHYDSERGVPGAIVNNVWRRGERIWDNNTFAQASFTKYFGKLATLNNAKFSYYRTRYVNNDDRQMHVDNIYRQREFYFSTANQYSITSKWNVALSYDLLWNDLRADMYDFAEPTRVSNFVALATALDLNRVRLQIAGVGTFIHDEVEGREQADNRSAFSPSAYLSVYPLNNRDLSLRAFYKKSFRMPTFNDLYYADMGNSKLNPERVEQYNLGVLFERDYRGFVGALRLSADAYYNRVKDKICAYPKGQQFRWTMLNLGLVDIRGIDFSGMVTTVPVKDLFVTFRCQYTYQRAIDITDPSDSYYRHRIPYIPYHSGSAVVNIVWRQWNLNYSWIYVGSRYNQQENIQYNYTQPWYTSDISVSRDIAIGKVNCRALLEINNLFSQDYDVIINYPMPKRNFRVTLTVTI